MTTRSIVPFRASRSALAVAGLCLLAAMPAFPQGAPVPNLPRPPLMRRPSLPGAPGAAVAPAAPATPGKASPMVLADDSPNSLNFQETAMDLVLADYAKRTNRTLLLTPNLPKPTITLQSNPGANLSEQEYLSAVEQILNLNGVALVPVGDKFLRVVPSAELSKYAPETAFPPVAPEDGSPLVDRYKENGSFVSRIVELKHIDLAEAKTVVDGFVRAGAQIQTFERTNSIRVTDSTDNVNRILEIIAYIDRPILAREEPNIIQLRFAKAEDIKARLLEIVNEAQAEANAKKSAPTERQSGAPGTVTRPLPAGVTLPRSATRPAAASESFEALVEEAERGVIRGKVQIIADERTNILIILTRPENMVFFNRIIAVLDVDVQTPPDVIVEVFRLEHAVAEDVATMMNELIGKESAKKDDKDAETRAPAAKGTEAGERSQPLADYVQRRQETRPVAETTTKSKVGQLDKENITILADERTNALVIMASNADMATIRDLIKSVDIMLSQVIIETVMVRLAFSDSVETGVDWVQRAMRVGDSTVYAAAGGGGKSTVQNPLGMTETVPGSAGIQFFGTLLDFNIDLLISAVKTDSRARIMSSPIITTLDNKEAVVESTDRIYYSEGTTYYDNSERTTSNIKNEDIGIKLKVTPRINKMGYVVLTIEQEIQDSDGYETIGKETLPKLTTRRMGADIAVQSGETVVLGGLARNEMSTTASRIPILGSIPFLGRLFRYDKQEYKRTDIIVFLTPRVINHSAEIENEARKRKASLETAGVWRSDWSTSDLADPISEKDRKAMLKRAGETVVPPRHALTGDLAPLNEKFGLKPEEPETAPEVTAP